MSNASTLSRHELGGLEARIPVDAADAGAPLERPVDAERAADPVVDQEAVGEADVRLEALHAGPGQTGSEGRDVARQVDLDAQHGLAREREECGLADSRRRGHLVKRVPVGSPDEKVGREAVVHDERRLAALEQAWGAPPPARWRRGRSA
jgi:hypothetical protein